MEDVRKLYLNRIDVYEEYRRGFEKEKLTVALYPVARFLSSLGYGLENNFFEVVHSRIPIEVYFLVDFFYDSFQCQSKFVLAEGRIFETDTVHDEISAELKRLPAPEPHGTQAKTLLTSIQSNNYTKISYESIMFDSALTWPLLLHEVFHDVYERNKLDDAHRSLITEDWVREVIIDLYSAMFLGPVYAVSLAKYHERFPSGGSLSHPGQSSRLYGLLQLLGNLVDGKADFPETVQQISARSFKIVNDIWLRYRKEKQEVQDRVQDIYEKVKQSATDFHHKKNLKPFVEVARLGGVNGQGEGFDAVARYLNAGIPAAVDPRVLFNALVIREDNVGYNYVSESIKKWYLSEKWARSLIELKSKLA
jgi:hypothetical protein